MIHIKGNMCTKRRDLDSPIAKQIAQELEMKDVLEQKLAKIHEAVKRLISCTKSETKSSPPMMIILNSNSPTI